MGYLDSDPQRTNLPGFFAAFDFAFDCALADDHRHIVNCDIDRQRENVNGFDLVIEWVLKFLCDGCARQLAADFGFDFGVFERALAAGFTDNCKAPSVIFPFAASTDWLLSEASPVKTVRLRTNIPAAKNRLKTTSLFDLLLIVPSKVLLNPGHTYPCAVQGTGQ